MTSAEHHKPCCQIPSACCILRYVQHEVLASQLVRALRGRRSQLALSRRLGFTTNVVYAWESGRRAPAASAFFRLALKSNIDFAARLRGFAGDALEDAAQLVTVRGVAGLLGALAQRRTLIDLARATRRDRTTLARWLRAETEPKLPELLAFVAATTQRLLEFVSLFVDPERLACARGAYRDLLAQRRLAYELPWSHAVLRALELSGYRALPVHRAGFIARQVGLSLDEEEQYLAALEQGKQLRRTRGGRYQVQRVLTVDTRPSEEDNRRLKQHWAEVALERFRSRAVPKDTLFSYNLFAISEPDFARVRALHLEYYERVREIVAASRDPERVVLMNLQLVPLEGGA
jgi:transcriptional regulator with XRE-family HTH domain